MKITRLYQAIEALPISERTKEKTDEIAGELFEAAHYVEPYRKK